MKFQVKISVPFWRPVRVGGWLVEGGGGGGLWNLKMGVVPCRAAYLGPTDKFTNANMYARIWKLASHAGV